MSSKQVTHTLPSTGGREFRVLQSDNGEFRCNYFCTDTLGGSHVAPEFNLTAALNDHARLLRRRGRVCMKRLLILAALLTGCGDDVPPSYCEPCIGEVPAECEDACMPDGDPQ